MAQYTFSFVNSEYDRIHIQLKKQLESAVDLSKADAETKALFTEFAAALDKAVTDLCKYAQDQLRVW